MKKRIKKMITHKQQLNNLHYQYIYQKYTGQAQTKNSNSKKYTRTPIVFLNVGNQATPRAIDNFGNTLSNNNGSDIYSYNQANRMQSYSSASTPIAEYYYNAIGQRIYKKQLDTNTHHSYLYNANGQLLAEATYNNTGNITQSKATIWLGNRPIAQVRTIAGVSSIYYILTDHLNTPRKVTNSTGTVLWSWNSDAFGKTPANQDVDGNGTDFEFNLRFPGQYFDKESGQHYNYFRDYEPSTGRYLQSDPIGLAGGGNTFGYVFQNPTKFTDMKGLQAGDDGFCYFPGSGGCGLNPPVPECWDNYSCFELRERVMEARAQSECTKCKIDCFATFLVGEGVSGEAKRQLKLTIGKRVVNFAEAGGKFLLRKVFFVGTVYSGLQAFDCFEECE